MKEEEKEEEEKEEKEEEEKEEEEKEEEAEREENVLWVIYVNLLDAAWASNVF